MYVHGEMSVHVLYKGNRLYMRLKALRFAYLTSLKSKVGYSQNKHHCSQIWVIWFLIATPFVNNHGSNLLWK